MHVSEEDYLKPDEFAAYVFDYDKESKGHKIEEVEVKAGKFEVVRVRLKSYLGKELQQQGRLTAWIATKKHPSRPLVKVEGELKFGSAYMELSKFKPGTQ